MSPTSSPSGLRISVAVIIALLVAVTIPTAIVLAVHDDRVDEAATSKPPVMPGHGSVMPTAVRVSGASGRLTVGVGDYWFKPSSRRIPAGKYRLSARNYGVIPHDVMIERAPIEFAAPGQPVDEAASYGVEDLEPGAAKSADEVILGPGRWVLFCSLSGHYTAGQRVTVEVYGRLPAGMEEARGGMAEDEEGGEAQGTGEAMGG